MPAVAPAYVEVYRVQDRTDGAGPYNPKSGEYYWTMIDAHGHDPQRPGPYEDGFADPYAISDAHLFGFESREACAAWFDGYLGGLTDRDYVLTVYRVRADQVMKGRHQLVFAHADACVVAVESLLDLADLAPSSPVAVPDPSDEGPSPEALAAIDGDPELATILDAWASAFPSTTI
ncbi:hypothetical protein SEA_MAGUCO_55 [Arthrobacter phage MaGuCo]|uniref:Uncharacterized protein n=1 Tax=Arthrobacter phage MaGuCo TaxID=3038363 RepID=A0AAF0JZR9_9CAUD|nr:hypothetical protein SEA_MAGUCO_55 [Arthrobacter phage MaGuCo]